MFDPKQSIPLIFGKALFPYLFWCHRPLWYERSVVSMGFSVYSLFWRYKWISSGYGSKSLCAQSVHKQRLFFFYVFGTSGSYILSRTFPLVLKKRAGLPFLKTLSIASEGNPATLLHGWWVFFNIYIYFYPMQKVYHAKRRKNATQSLFWKTLSLLEQGTLIVLANKPRRRKTVNFAFSKVSRVLSSLKIHFYWKWFLEGTKKIVRVE